MDLPEISIIVPCYNQSQFLDETLESVFLQTFKNWECIIVNDGSLDNTDNIAKVWTKKDKRFRYLYKDNGGLSSARNAGVNEARAEYIYPLDADDLISNTLLEKIIFKFHDSNYPQIVYCNVAFFGAKKGSYKLPVYNYQKLLVQNCFIACSAFKKSDWIKVGGFDEALKSFEDWDFWIRILNKESNVSKIEEELFFYRKHESGSLTNNFSVDSRFYYGLYDAIYIKNKAIYDAYYGNPILAFQENLELKVFNEKIKNLWIFKLYVKIKKRYDKCSNKK